MSGTMSKGSEPFEVNGIKYVSGKLNAFQQFHVLRKLGPVIAKIGPGFMMLEPTVKVEEDGTVTTVPNLDMLDNIATMAPALEALSEMSEADCNFVLERCLAVTRRFQEPGSWINVWNEQAKRLQFEDIDLVAMMKIAMHVLGESLAGFSLGGALSTGAPSPQQNDPLNTSTLRTVKIS